MSLSCREYISTKAKNDDRDKEEFLAASSGKLPVIPINVKFRTEALSRVDLAEWETRFDLKLLGETIGEEEP